MFCSPTSVFPLRPSRPPLAVKAGGKEQRSRQPVTTPSWAELEPGMALGALLQPRPCKFQTSSDHI